MFPLDVPMRIMKDSCIEVLSLGVSLESRLSMAVVEWFLGFHMDDVGCIIC